MREKPVAATTVRGRRPLLPARWLRAVGAASLILLSMPLLPENGAQSSAASSSRNLGLFSSSPGGSFDASPGGAGSFDMRAWALERNLAAGEPPRLRPRQLEAQTGTGSWSALGSNGSGNGALTNTVTAVAVSANAVYVGGTFVDAAGIPQADYLAMWNGSTWSALGSNGSGGGAINGYVNALAVSGSDLYVGGNFTNAGGVPTADYVAKWNGSTWSALGSNGSGDGALNNDVSAIEVSGNDVYVGGIFQNAGGVATADYLAEWNGNTWSGLGSNGTADGAIGCGGCVVDALGVSGGDVYVGGQFPSIAGNALAANIAEWNGSSWSALGSNGSGGAALVGQVLSLAISGSDVYVGGLFGNVATIAQADFLAKWNGSAWSAVGSNGSGNGALSNVVRAISVSGTAIYVGGIFGVAGNPKAGSIAAWNGSAWSALAASSSGSSALTNGSGVFALAASPTALFVGCGCVDIAGIPEADFIASWPLSAAANTNAGPSLFRNSIPTPAEINLDLATVVLPTLVAGVGIVVLVPFPGTLFNSTLRTNYAELMRRGRRARRRLRNAVLHPWFALAARLPVAFGPQPIALGEEAPMLTSPPAAEQRHDFWWTWPGVGVFVLLTALLSSFLDPAFWLDAASLPTFIGMLVGLVLILAAFDVPAFLYYRRSNVRFWPRALPGTFVVALACVAISRLTDFHPGYLYGLVITTAVAASLGNNVEGRLLAAGVILTLVVAAVAWFALGVVAPAARASSDPLLVGTHTVLSMLVSDGVQVTAFALLPISFLAGDSVRKWNPWVHAVLWLFGLTAFGIIILNPHNGYLSDSTRTPLLTIVVLFALFSAGSVGFWKYFRDWHRRMAKLAAAGAESPR